MRLTVLYQMPYVMGMLCPKDISLTHEIARKCVQGRPPIETIHKSGRHQRFRSEPMHVNEQAIGVDRFTYYSPVPRVGLVGDVLRDISGKAISRTVRVALKQDTNIITWQKSNV